MKVATLVPMFYYPLKIIFVDDNEDLLKLFTDNFADKFRIQVFSDPKIALEYIRERNSVKERQSAEISNIINSDDHAQVGINIKNIVKMANKPDRFDKIGILVSDQEMPGMNGLDLCAKLENYYIKKILLTGRLLDKAAIQALNDSTINCYVEKAAVSAVDDIERYINILMQRYFVELTQSVLQNLEQNQLTILQNSEFITIFKEILATYKIKEYYLLDIRGSYLLIDENAKRYVLNVHNQESLDEFCNFFAGEKAIEPLLKSSKNYEKIPFFGIGMDPINVPLTEWDKHFYPATKNDSFVWSLVE